AGHLGRRGRGTVGDRSGIERHAPRLEILGETGRMRRAPGRLAALAAGTKSGMREHDRENAPNKEIALMRRWLCRLSMAALCLAAAGLDAAMATARADAVA